MSNGNPWILKPTKLLLGYFPEDWFAARSRQGIAYIEPTSPRSWEINYIDFLSLLTFSKEFLFWPLSQIGAAPNYLRDHIRSSLCATSHRSFRSFDWQVLFVPRVKTTMAQTRSFANIGPSLWNALPPSLQLTLLSGSLPASFSLIKTFYTLGVFTLGALLSGPYCERHFINEEIQYNTMFPYKNPHWRRTHGTVFCPWECWQGNWFDAHTVA